MRFISKVKDGGPESPVDGFFLFEIKSFASIVFLRFNKGSREAFHTHAFNALTWFLSGDLVEEDITGALKPYKKGFMPKVTRRYKNHRVIANKTSWCLSIRGPWAATWTEDTTTHTKVLTHGRRIIKIITR